MSPSDRLATRRAELVELDLAQRRGDLAPVAEMALSVEKRLTSVRAKLLAIPSKVAPQVAPPAKMRQAEAVLTRAIHEALTDIATNGRSRVD